MLLCKNFILSKFKNIEFQLDIGWLFNSCIYPFNISLELRRKQDHPGWQFQFGMFCMFNFMMTFYDCRHYEEIYDDENINE